MMREFVRYIAAVCTVIGPFSAGTVVSLAERFDVAAVIFGAGAVLGLGALLIYGALERDDEARHQSALRGPVREG